MKKLMPIVFILVLIVGNIALAGLYLEIPATVVDKTYTLDLAVPTWIKITLKDLVANTNMDNLGLSFRDNEFDEILNIFIKTNGYIHITSPKYGIPDTQLGQWEDGTEIYIKFGTDKITVYLGDPLITDTSYSFDASNYDVYDVRVHSNDDTNKAFINGTIIIRETMVVEPIDVSSTINSMLPIVFTIITIAIPVLFLKYILKILKKIF